MQKTNTLKWPLLLIFSFLIIGFSVNQARADVRINIGLGYPIGYVDHHGYIVQYHVPRHHYNQHHYHQPNKYYSKHKRHYSKAYRGHGKHQDQYRYESRGDHHYSRYRDHRYYR